MTATPVVQIYSVYINAPAQRVWDALTTSSDTNRWGYGGDVDYDLTAGGSYTNFSTPAMRAMGMGDVATSGTVVSAEPPTRLELTWVPAWHPDYAPTTLIWELTEYPGGVTQVKLTHDVSAAPELAAEVGGGGDPVQGGGGWPWVLSSLKTLLETDAALPGAGS